MRYYAFAWRKYFDFSGRASRREYWMFTLVHTVILLAGILLGVGIPFLFPNNFTLMLVAFFPLFWGAYMIAALLPGIAVTVRRLHDVGKSGAWIWAAAIPVMGLWVIVLLAREGDQADNAFGKPVH